jgi:hypothetical protein
MVKQAKPKVNKTLIVIIIVFQAIKRATKVKIFFKYNPLIL